MFLLFLPSSYLTSCRSILGSDVRSLDSPFHNLIRLLLIKRLPMGCKEMCDKGMDLMLDEQKECLFHFECILFILQSKFHSLSSQLLLIHPIHKTPQILHISIPFAQINAFMTSSDSKSTSSTHGTPSTFFLLKVSSFATLTLFAANALRRISSVPFNGAAYILKSSKGVCRRLGLGIVSRWVGLGRVGWRVARLCTVAAS